MEKSGIYRWYCIDTKKCYVGQSIDLDRRKQDHLEELRKGVHHNKYLQNTYDKYGESSLVFEILELVTISDDIKGDRIKYRDYLIPYEQKWIDFYKSSDREFGYNLAPVAGSITGYTFTVSHKKVLSDEHRQKISESSKHPKSTYRGKPTLTSEEKILRRADRRKRRANVEKQYRLEHPKPKGRPKKDNT